MSKLFESLQPHLDKIMALSTAQSLFGWDEQTSAPSDASEYTSKVIGILSNEFMKTLINDEVRSLLDELNQPEERALLTDIQKGIVKKLNKAYEDLEHIPPEEYRAYNEMIPLANRKWAKARSENNFSDFAPYLKQIIDTKKRFAAYRAKEGEIPYEVLLKDFDECFGIQELDEFFEKVKKEIIPLLKRVAAQSGLVDKSYNYRNYDIQKQREFNQFLSTYVGFNHNRGVVAESTHPFTLQLHNHDVRITTRYIENNLESAMFSLIHECGHALYEMNVDDALTQTLLGEGASMGMHESQSRFYENLLGRSKAFWEPLYPKLLELYPEQLNDVTLDHFILGINKAEPSLIRTEADELSYTLHIIIRYEIEKMLFTQDIDVNELPAIWNSKYEEYLGITPPTDTEGILQDTHWSWGEFGYFPSYAIGTAISSQLYATLNKKLPIEDYLREGNLTPIHDFLKESVHRFGASKNTKEILLEVTGENLNADYYVDYLKNKYSALYPQ